MAWSKGCRPAGGVLSPAHGGPVAGRVAEGILFMGEYWGAVSVPGLLRRTHGRITAAFDRVSEVREGRRGDAAEGRFDPRAPLRTRRPQCSGQLCPHGPAPAPSRWRCVGRAVRELAQPWRQRDCASGGFVAIVTGAEQGT